MEPPTVELPRGLADWLAACGVLRRDAAGAADAQPLVFVSAEEWGPLQNGVAVATLLKSSGYADGAAPQLRAGNTAKDRLHNWRALAPALARAGAALTDDVSALLVGADADALRELLQALQAPLQARSAALHARAAAPAAALTPMPNSASFSADDRAAEEAAAAKDASDNRRELLLSTLMQCAGLYSIMVASLLTVFTSQSCSHDACYRGATYTGAIATVCAPTSYTCSTSDNLAQGGSRSFGRFVTGWNFATLAAFLCGEAFFFARERWLIANFSEDKVLSHDNLESELLSDEERYGQVRAQLRRYNRAALGVAVALATLLLANFGLSAARVLAPGRRAGVTGVTGLLSNAGLVLAKVVGWAVTAWQACHQRRALLLFSNKNRVLNAVDANLRLRTGGGAKAV